ncbi:MAG: OPT family oligopeptide transporter [Legionella sp.]
MALKPTVIVADLATAELTMRSIILAILLTMLLAMSNAFLALKLGILTSASIPAAIISMGILRLFKNANILENNAVQTAASAGEAVAGGIVYTIPALVIIGYWNHFDYLTNFLIAAIGGVLGVLFSIPLRKILVNDKSLKFPEGRAIAEVLKSSSDRVGLNHILLGGLVGAGLELLQTGFKLIAASWSYWFVIKRSLFGLGLGFSATMIGAGYLIGQDMAVSIFIGAIFTWLIALPIISQCYPNYLLHASSTQEAVSLLWDSEMRYLGIGAMLFAGTWTFIKLLKPLFTSIHYSARRFAANKVEKVSLPRTEKDIPTILILVGIAGMAVLMFYFFQQIFPLTDVQLVNQYARLTVIGAVIYVLVIGFLFSVITAYFSGMVGVTASPGSSIVIAGILFAAWLLLSVLNHVVPLPLSIEQIQAAEAITIIIGSIVTGIAAIANDNTQDLKVGQLVGATPWKQQLMLLLGVIVSALVIPPVMQLLFDVYGIAGVLPRAGMDPAQTLPAPTAALLAAITDALFRNTMPWMMMLVGGSTIAIVILFNRLFKLQRYMNLSILGIAIGMYLPLSSSFPLFIGGMIACLVQYRLRQHVDSSDERNQRQQIGSLIACGFVAGAALMDVLLAIPFSIFHSPDILSLFGNKWHGYDLGFALLATIWLVLWIQRRVCH